MASAGRVRSLREWIAAAMRARGANLTDVVVLVVATAMVGNKMGVRAEQQALAKWGLNYVIDEYLPRKLANEKSFLP